MPEAQQLKRGLSEDFSSTSSFGNGQQGPKASGTVLTLNPNSNPSNLSRSLNLSLARTQGTWHPLTLSLLRQSSQLVGIIRER